MPTQHVVVAGENLTVIANQNGFGSGDAILADPSNAELRNRPHPAILDPGEVLTLPDLQAKKLSLGTNSKHGFTVKRPTAKLTLAVRTFRGGVTAATDARVALGERPPAPQSLGGGQLKMDVPLGIAEATVSTPPAGDGLPPLEWKLALGALGRPETDDGALARLRNLGYYRAVDGDADERERRSAVEEFQKDNGVALSGALDQATKTKIADVHGC